MSAVLKLIVLGDVVDVIPRITCAPDEVLVDTAVRLIANEPPKSNEEVGVEAKIPSLLFALSQTKFAEAPAFPLLLNCTYLSLPAIIWLEYVLHLEPLFDIKVTALKSLIVILV